MRSSLKDFVSSSVSHWSPASSIFFRVKIFTSILPNKKNKTHNTHTLYNKIKKHCAADNQDEEWWEHKSGWRNMTKTALIYWTSANEQILPSSFDLTWSSIRSIWQQMREIYTLGRQHWADSLSPNRLLKWSFTSARVFYSAHLSTVCGLRNGRLRLAFFYEQFINI